MQFCLSVYERAARAITPKNFDDAEKEVDIIPAHTDNRPNICPERSRRVCIGTGWLPFEAEPEVVLKVKERIYFLMEHSIKRQNGRSTDG